MRKRTGGCRPHGDAWQINYRDINGQRQYETHSTEEEARRILLQRLSEVANGIPVSSKPNTVLFEELAADVVNDYIVHKRQTTDDLEARFRKHILPVFGKKKAAQITTAQITAYIVQRQNRGAKDATIANELAAIRRAFLLAAKGRKLLVYPHVPMLKPQNTRTGFFTRDEVERLCHFLNEPYRSFVWFAFLTGWRKEEIQTLQWVNVDFRAGEIRLWVSKNREPRVFPMTIELRTLLEAIAPTARHKAVHGRPDVSIKAMTTQAQHVFSIARIDPVTGLIRHEPVGEFRKTWARALHNAGLPVRIEPQAYVVKRGKDKGKTRTRIKRIVALRMIHDLRRSAAREMENQGVPRSVIKELMGHKTDSMFSRYRIVSAADKKRAADIINGATNGGKAGR